MITLTEFYTIYAAFMVVIFAVFVVVVLRRRGRFKAYVYSPVEGRRTHYIKPGKSKDELVMIKATDQQRGWTLKLKGNCIVYEKGRFGKLTPTVQAFFRAPEAWTYDYDGEKSGVKMPLLTQEQAAKINRLEAFIIRFTKLPQMKMGGAVLFLLIGVIMVVIVLQIMGMRGIRF